MRKMKMKKAMKKRPDMTKKGRCNEYLLRRP